MNRSRLSFTAANARGLALRRERGAAREPLREHLHFGRGRRGGRVLRRAAGSSRNTMNAANTRNVDQQHAEHLELLDDRQVADQRQLARHLRSRDVAVRSCSMIDTDASGS